ncbi:MAG TPA: ATP-binding protein [Methanotrichaceae archaeon]|nr:ATP-binding protein [Methanotrichaceae archaeon]
MEEDHEITVVAKTEEIPVISEFIEKLMKTYGFDTKKIMEVQLAAEEACTNIALYAYPGRVGNIHIEAKVDDSFQLNIEDDGTPFDPTKRDAPPTQAGAEERPIGGLGIYLIKTYVDDVSYEFKEGKNILRLVKNKA